MRTLTLLALVLAALPYLAGFLAAPRGFAFLGSLNNVGDTGQYLAAIRQGMGGHLLYTNQYTDLHVAPVLMYPLYTITGLALAPFGLAPLAAYTLLHVLAAMLLLAALWRFCRVVLPERAVLAYALALFGGGLYVPALLLSGVVKLPFAPVALTAPEFSLFATLLITPHGAIGLAAELWALGGYLWWRRSGSARGLAALALGGVALGLSYPFGIPVLLAVVGADLIVVVATNNTPTCEYAAEYGGRRCPGGAGVSPVPASVGHGETIRQERRSMRGTENALRGWPTLTPATTGTSETPALPSREASKTPGSPSPYRERGGARRPPLLSLLRESGSGGVRVALALLPTLGIALYYFVLFRHDPLWGASNMLRLQPPSLPLLAAAFGPLLALAIPSLRHALTSAVAPRLVALWAIINGLLLLAPLPQSERLLSGWSVPLALLAALTLAGKRPRAARRWVIALSLSNVMMALLYLVVALSGANRSYYAPADEAAAVGWLAAHARSSDVVMASAGSGNLVVAAAPCRVVVGQNFETFDWTAAQRDVLDYYAASTPPARRAAIVRGRRVTFVLAGPYERALGRFTPHGPAYRLAYRSDSVLIYRVVKA